LVDINSSINIRICSRTYQLIYIYIYAGQIDSGNIARKMKLKLKFNYSSSLRQ